MSNFFKPNLFINDSFRYGVNLITVSQYFSCIENRKEYENKNRIIGLLPYKNHYCLFIKRLKKFIRQEQRDKLC